MAKNYDVSAKELIDASPAAWAKLSHLVTDDAQVTLIDADASAISAVADKVAEIREKKKLRYMIMEFQAQHDIELIPNCAIRELNLRRQKGTITADTVIFFATAGALPKGGTLGKYEFKRANNFSWVFEYTAIKLWELKPDDIFALGPQMAPLATLCKIKPKTFPKLVERIETELKSIESKEDQNRLWAIAFFLSGIKYKDADYLQKIFTGKFNIESSSTYQLTAQRFRERGQIEDAQTILTEFQIRKTGSISQEDEKLINSINDPQILRQAVAMLTDAKSWEEVMEFLR